MNGSKNETFNEEELNTVLTEGEDSGEKNTEDSDKSSDDAGDKDASKDTGQKVDADKKSEDGKTDKDKDGAPEKYQDFSIPEGMEVDPEAMTGFASLSKEANLSQSQAQKFIDLQSGFMKQIFDTQQKAWVDKQSEWRETAENDDEYGKGKYDESTVIARKAMREIGGTKLTQALQETGMGNHPEFIRFFYRVGKMIGEDNLSFGTANQEGSLTQAERMFPDQGKKK